MGQAGSAVLYAQDSEYCGLARLARHHEVLSYFHHNKLIYISYFLLKTLQHMAHTTKGEEYPKMIVTNHALVKIIFLESIKDIRKTWEQFLGLSGEFMITKHSVEKTRESNETVKNNEGFFY